MSDYTANIDEKFSPIITILIVDDRPENIQAYKAVLTRTDYKLVCVSSGEEALRKILNQDFAVVLMDVQMPGLNGFETARLIKKRQKSKHTPIIFITANNQTIDHMIHGYVSGGIDYIFKPFNPDMLRMKVEAFVEIYRNKEQINYQRELLKQRTIELDKAYLELEEEKRQQKNQLEKLVTKRTEELVQANQELEKSKERFYKIVHSSPSLISIHSTETGKYIDVNESWMQQTGYTYKEVLENTYDLLNISFTESVSSDFDYYTKIKARNEKITFLTKSGEKRDGLASFESIEINGEPCTLLVIVDITRKMRMEGEIARLDRLNLIGEMAAGIAHEIRNPMTTVRGFLQISKSITTSEYIDIMLDELDRANNIITEYLTLAKNKHFSLEPKDINTLIQAILPLIRAEAALSNKQVDVQLEACPNIYIDEKEIRQLLLNLTLNGLDAMEKGKRLFIQTYSNNGKVILIVKDEGCGIKKDILDKIWNPFFTTKEQGTGLGLAICYSVASRHSAAIDVETSENGTTFMVSFPSENSIIFS